MKMLLATKHSFEKFSHKLWYLSWQTWCIPSHLGLLIGLSAVADNLVVPALYTYSDSTD